MKKDAKTNRLKVLFLICSLFCSFISLRAQLPSNILPGVQWGFTSPFSTLTSSEDWLYGVRSVDDGYVGVGYTEPASTDTPIAIKVDKNGNIVWKTQISTNFGFGLQAFETTSGYMVFGHLEQTGGWEGIFSVLLDKNNGTIIGSINYYNANTLPFPVSVTSANTIVQDARSVGVELVALSGQII